jgi:esterase/lipase superfamily enzyme
VIYLLDFRSSDTGGAVVPGVVVSAPGLGTEQELRSETSLTFIVHGYNVNRRSGRESLLRAAQRLSAAHPVSYVGVLWPGDHWTRALSYPFEGRDADDSAAALVRYIQDVVAPGSELSFAAHSLGARVALGAVKRLRAGYTVGEVCLMAAAVDDTSVAHPGDYLRAVGRARRVAVLASRRDRVLSLAYPAGDLLQSFIFFRTDRAGLALGFLGPRRT